MNESTTADAASSAYDDVPYATRANRSTHPDRLATIATLMGLQPTPVSRCRVLELGCGNGSNLIAMAVGLPQATFTGCDLAAKAITAGQRFADGLGLANVTLLQQDLRTIPESLGNFDYIVAHGLYSWVPAEVRDAMLALIARRLSPQGIAFVSYNVYPGCYVRRMAWEILKFHVDEAPDAATRLAEARALIALVTDPANREEPHNAGMRAEFRELGERTDSALFHDDLSPVNEPLYFHEFIAHAQDHDLQFLGEADFGATTDIDVAPAVRTVLSAMDRLSREQYLDFVRGRRFRQTLLCHAGLAPDRDLVPERLANLWAVAQRIITAKGVAFPSVASNETTGEGQSIASNAGTAPEQAMVDDAVEVLREITLAWPRPMTVADLAQGFRARAKDSHPDVEIPPRLAEILIALYGASAINLHTYVPQLPDRAGERPVASALARAQVAEDERVTNAWHENIGLDDPLARQLLPLLDGTRDRDALLGTLGPSFHTGPNESPAELLERYLTHCVRLGLLVA